MKKIKTIYLGVRYRENPTRKYQGKPDKYFFIRYQGGDGKEREEPAGWAPENSLNATKVNEIRAELIHNIRMGLHPQSLAEKREMEQAEIIRVEAEKARNEELAKQVEKQNITFGDAAESFLKWSEANKKTFRDDQHRYKQRLEKPLSRVRLKDVSPAYIDTLKAGWMKKVSPKTVDHYLSRIHCIYEHAINSLKIQIENPVKKVKRPEYDNRKTSAPITVEFNPTVILCIACCLQFLHPVSKIIQFVQPCRKDTLERLDAMLAACWDQAIGGDCYAKDHAVQDSPGGGGKHL